MNAKEHAFLEGIVRDCRRLERAGELTQFGRGQKILAEALLGGDVE
ncbi:MAG: hypothetical protein OXR66_03925 [Candidatus Woesearchaeota archaeon]|nr:hypothetical protein [Candidatus Woesearchaeota archaeon]